MTAKGTILAWCEARKNAGEDWDDIDILLRRSTDDGKTWSEAKARRRIIVTSPDGATQWSEPRFQEDLIDPVCMAGLTRYNHSGKNLLLFSNPDTPRGHRNVTVRVSMDEGKTWPISRSVEKGFSTYSDVNVTPSGTILCFYGRSEKANFAGDRLTVARFDIEWLLQNTTPDLNDSE